MHRSALKYVSKINRGRGGMKSKIVDLLLFLRSLEAWSHCRQWVALKKRSRKEHPTRNIVCQNSATFHVSSGGGQAQQKRSGSAERTLTKRKWWWHNLWATIQRHGGPGLLIWARSEPVPVAWFWDAFHWCGGGRGPLGLRSRAAAGRAPPAAEIRGWNHWNATTRRRKPWPTCELYCPGNCPCWIVDVLSQKLGF